MKPAQFFNRPEGKVRIIRTNHVDSVLETGIR